MSEIVPEVVSLDQLKVTIGLKREQVIGPPHFFLSLALELEPETGYPEPFSTSPVHHLDS